MTVVGTNITFSQDFCNLATGFVAGEAIALMWLGKILSIIAFIYFTKKVSEAIIEKIKRKRAF